VSAPTPPSGQRRGRIDWPAITIAVLGLLGFVALLAENLPIAFYLTLVAILVAILRGQREE
jgi:hypothetical protein